MCRKNPSELYYREHLSADGMIGLLRERWSLIGDSRRQASVNFPMVDVLASAFALFSLKDSSLLMFQDRVKDRSIQNLYGVKNVPSDTQLREILDGIDLNPLHQSFVDLFSALQQGKALEKFVFHNGYYLLVIDGTEYFSSETIHCDDCLKREKKNGKIEYYHQAVVATIVHPDHSEVFPLAVEPIIKQDGSNKNDCERNAAVRLLRRIRQQHPRLKIIVVQDGLSSNAPHIALLKELRFEYLLICQETDHQFLFEQATQASEDDLTEDVSVTHFKGKTKCQSHLRFVHDLPLNKSNQGTRVNLFSVYETKSESDTLTSQFSWVTGIEIPKDYLFKFSRGGRSRWRIENETFNTLKNQGYNFEHNFGHGSKNLSTVLLLIMFLAFFVDQIQQSCCRVFKAVMGKLGTRKALWDSLRSHFRHFAFDSFRQLWLTILSESGRNRPPPEIPGY
jgi:hypothetical protein